MPEPCSAGAKPNIGLAQQNSFHDALLARIRALPGVTGGGIVSFLHIGGDMWSMPFNIEGRPARGREETPRASFKMVTAGFFYAAGSSLVRGRDFSPLDHPGAPRVVIINETLARRFWPGQDPVGQGMRTGFPGSSDPLLTVAGVARDVHQQSLSDPVRPKMYFAYTQNPMTWWSNVTLVVRGLGDAASLTRAVQNEVWALDASLPVTHVRTMEQILDQAVAQPRFDSTLVAVFAATALALSLIGINGVLSYAVSQRVQEIGIRMALGAGPAQILRLVLGHGVALTIIGLGIGLAGAAVLSRYLSSLLFQVSPSDPGTFLAVAALLTVVALAASYVPARRAIAVDPMVALRHE